MVKGVNLKSMLKDEETHHSVSVSLGDDISFLNLERLIRCGEHKQALDTILEWKNNDRPFSEEFAESLEQLSLLARLCLGDVTVQSLTHSGANTYELISALIPRSVQLGLLDLADELAGSNDTYGTYQHCELIISLYTEGYVERAKSKLMQLNAALLTEAHPPFTRPAYIFGEILHDEGRFEEAAVIFERIAQQFPDMAKARFAASSCYLHTTMNRLMGRIELYRPGEEEQLRIEKYLNDISEALNIVHSTNWHTSWSPAQSRNLPPQPSKVIH